MYKELDVIPNLPEFEKQILKYWEEIKVLDGLKKARKGSKRRIYYDGPITTNNIPHYGHAITWAMKDIVPRYWSMKGFDVPRNMGWDTKGIMVEFEVEKELGFIKKEEIQQFGEEKFIQYCRDFVNKYKKIMYEYEIRLGRWIDPEAEYSTDDPSFVESEWWSLKRLFELGLLYEGHKTVAYSTRAGMTLSTHEVNDGGYKEVEDPYVTVKFKLKGSKNTYFLAWTTTPWTIPGNLMLAVNKKLKYVYAGVGDEVYILAKDRVKEVLKGKKFNIEKEVSGEKLESLEYEQPYPHFEKKRAERCFRVILSSHATAEDGTGIVHLAPYGEEDFEIFQKLGIKLFDYLDEVANFTELVPEYKGQFYKQANPNIISYLNEKGRLFESGTLMHRMPMCYRTGTPLIYKPVKSWYIAVSKIREKMISENKKVNWYPERIKEGISGMWIKNARDWALSRNRYWGTPFPLWVNDKTGEKVFIGSFEELKQLSGVEIKDPHRPVIDNVTWEDKKNGGTFRRVKEVIDVWYDSGSMPFAQINYPFNKSKQLTDYMPAEYISEGPDQVHLWFYVMHVLGVALFGKVPYQNVATIGTMLDESGKKMSKSKRNYKPMDEVLADYGADVLRYFILTSSIVSGEDAIFSADLLNETRKNFFLPLWNSARYFTTYANLNNFKPKANKHSNDILDMWVLTRLKQLSNQLTESMDGYKIMEASRSFFDFVTDLSTWYIRRSRDRIRDGDLQSLETAHNVLSQLSILLSPFVPFLSEKLYQTLMEGNKKKFDSVHLCLYPIVKKLRPSENKLLDDMSFVREIVEKGHSQRKTSGLKVRQPLSQVIVTTQQKPLNSEFCELIKDELNVKNVTFKSSSSKDTQVLIDLKLTEDLKMEGQARDFIRAVQELRKEAKVNISENVDVEYPRDLTETLTKFGDYVKQKAKIKNLIPSDKLMLVK